MDGWQNGRRELLEEIAKIYDKVRENVETELRDENSILVSRDEFRKLQNANIRVGVLECEIIDLRGHQASTSNDARLVREKTAENERLDRENARLAAELKKYQSVFVQAQARHSEEQDDLLVTEAQAVRKQQNGEKAERQAHRAAKLGYSMLAPISTNSLLSTCRVENNDSKSIALETYNSLVTKYNQVFQNWTDIKATRTQLENSLRVEKDKAKRYNLFCDGLEKKLAQKRDKIRQLEAKVRSLEGEVQILRQSNTAEVTQAAGKKVNAANFEDDGRDFESATFDMLDKRQTVRNDIRIFNSPVGKKVAAISPRIKFPTSSDPELPNCSESQLAPDARFGDQDDGDSYSTRPERQHEPEHLELPLISDGERDGNNTPQEVTYEPAETCHSSSTDDHGTASPTDSRGIGLTIKREPHEDTQSLQDIPVIVQERSVRKKKPRNNPGEVSKIKVETISSSPIGLAVLHGLEAQESIDLDDIGNKQMTPRKQRALMHNLARPVPYGPRSVSRSSQKNRQETESVRLQSSIPKGAYIFQETPMNRQVFRAGTVPRSSSAKEILAGTSSEHAKKRRRVTHNIAIQELVEDGESIGGVERSSSLSEWSDSDGRLMELLENPTPLNHIAIKPTTPTPVDSVDYGSKLPVLLSGTSSVWATSGLPGNMPAAFNPSPTILPSNEINPRRHENTPKDCADDRPPKLRDHFNGFNGQCNPTIQVSRSMTAAKLLTPGNGNLPRGIATPQLSKTASNPAPTIGQSSSMKRSSRLQDPDCGAKNDLENGPLRFRPLSEICLHDFKINPEYNNGYDYAFTDVVRKQAARRCLPGCTKPECCGSIFRALAAAAHDPTMPPTASQEEAEMRLLKEFLGDNTYKIRNMTRAERDEVLLQARTRELANKHGKHRHAYERRRSPPGFWRMDFPSTQEEREDRQRVEQLERDVVAQRYNEAMRPGGAYLFRDE